MENYALKKYTTFTKGFALLDLFLALALFITMSAGIYALLHIYYKKTTIQTTESDIIRVAQAYALILNQTSIKYGIYDILYAYGSQISNSFLKTIPIPQDRIGSTVLGNVPGYNTIPYSYLLTTLLVNGKRSVVGFETLSTTGNSTTPSMRYFIIGLQVTDEQALQFIQDLSKDFSIFIGGANEAVNQAALVKSLPSCPSKNCIYNLYLCTPSLSDPSTLQGSFTAPTAGLS